jgi:CheY-like chemotaxis protein
VSRRVLVVEDNAHDRSLVAFLLRAFGYSAAIAPSGDAALEIARRDRFDLVLLDLLMPAMDGFETLAAMRADEALAGTPIVALTILSGEEEHERILAAGFDGHIEKPIAPEGFDAQLSAFLPRRETAASPADAKAGQ